MELNYAQQSIIHRLALQLRTLRQGPTPYGLAPHKPILLLSLIDYMDEVGLSENRFPMTDRLHEIFKENWQLLVRSGNVCDITKPLFHLKGDKIWTLAIMKGKIPERELSSFRKYQEIVAYGSLLPELFDALRIPEGREVMRIALLSRYFLETEANYYNLKGDSPAVLEADAHILQEPQPVYATRKISIRSFEGFIRDLRFQTQVLQKYGNACAITQYKVDCAPIVQACHIEPFSFSGNNSIQNGIALCANLHLAFDYGLISLDEQFRVLVKPKTILLESGEKAYSLFALKGKKIQLPAEPRFYPGKEYLEHHRNRWDF